MAKALPQKISDLPSIKELLVFSIPQFALMLCHLCISFTDIWVSSKLGNSVQAGLGIVAQYYMMLMLIISFSGNGFSSSIAQSLGAKKYRRAKYYLLSMLFICFFFGIFVSFTSIALLEYTPLIQVNDHEVLQIVRTFLLAYCINLPFYYIMVMINSSLRAYKYTKVPFKTIALVCIVNFISSLGFGLGMFGLPNYGYYGVAYSTTLSGIVGCLYNCWNLYKLELITFNTFPNKKWLTQALPYVFKIGLPAGISAIVSQSGSFIIMLIILTLPINTGNIIAGMTIGSRLQSIVLFIMGAISISLGILVGHLMGARNFEYIAKFGKKLLKLSFLAGLFFATLLFIFSDVLTQIFSADEIIATEAKFYLNFACLMLPFMCANSVIGGIFSGTGANKLGAYVNVCLIWLINIPLSYTLAKTLNYGIIAIYSVSLLVSILSFFFLTLLFWQNKWQKYGLIKVAKHIR